jgi:hypothetical protein
MIDISLKKIEINLLKIKDARMFFCFSWKIEKIKKDCYESFNLFISLLDFISLFICLLRKLVFFKKYIFD